VALFPLRCHLAALLLFLCFIFLMSVKPRFLILSVLDLSFSPILSYPDTTITIYYFCYSSFYIISCTPFRRSTWSPFSRLVRPVFWRFIYFATVFFSLLTKKPRRRCLRIPLYFLFRLPPLQSPRKPTTRILKSCKNVCTMLTRNEAVDECYDGVNILYIYIRNFVSLIVSIIMKCGLPTSLYSLFI